jgi:hypothetical protein
MRGIANDASEVGRARAVEAKPVSPLAPVARAGALTYARAWPRTAMCMRRACDVHEGTTGLATTFDDTL